ncbi:MAG TPA: PilZ domain-containing protein [Smithella sp.]|nr:PilZ domain-containing protein [Smithella sp.]
MMKKKDPEAKNNEERIFVKDRIISKRLKDGNRSDETEALMKSARKAERLDEENEIVITILSEITNLPKEKVIYNYSEDISMTGTRIQGNVLLPIDTFLKIDLVLKNLKQKITVFGKVKRNKVLVEGESYEAGVEFVDTPDESIKKLENYILSINQYKNLNPVGVPYWIFAKFNKPASK